MSLSQDPTLSLLKSNFVCGTLNITGAQWSGVSGLHPVCGGAVDTTNGAGPHNIQIFVLSPDGTVLTCLPGYWNTEDLALELQLAEKLNKVWTDPGLTRSQKDALFTQMHRDHIKEHPMSMVSRSEMQDFDKEFELKHRPKESDTILAVAEGVTDRHLAQFRTTDVILHERMAKRPFVRYSEFDVATFSDYGRPKYDKNEEGGSVAVDQREGVPRKAKRKMARR